MWWTRTRRLIHEYFGINLPIIWAAVQNKPDSLEIICRKLLEKGAEPNEKKFG